jgi:hypothetical protein
MKYCKPGYVVYYSKIQKQYILEFPDGNYIEEGDISSVIIESFKKGS